MHSVMTVKGREKLLKARAEGIPVPRIAGFAFGEGGVDGDGNVIMPDETQNVLLREILRKPIDGYEFQNNLVCRYTCTLAEYELVDKFISEMALYDESGDLVCIKNFKPKAKDDDLEMGFMIDDSFETEVL